MQTNLVNLVFNEQDEREEAIEFAKFGQEILESESLTNNIYASYIALMAKSWEGGGNMYTECNESLSINDIGLLYTIGPYIPCVERITLTQSIDVVSDGMPGIRAVGGATEGSGLFQMVRPIPRYPRNVISLHPNAKKYKLVSYLGGKKDKNDKMEVYVMYFGVLPDGMITTPVDKYAAKPWFFHGAGRAYPALVSNSWADAKYQWLVETTEDIGLRVDVRLRLGVNKESIKSLFYARSLPLTETGRKRPILHWVRSHQRRIKEGVDIDVSTHLRGITEFNMHGIAMRITQPDKDALQGADPESVKEAFALYAPNRAHG